MPIDSRNSEGYEDPILDNLPEDDKQAFAVVEERLRKELFDNVDPQDETWQAERDYVSRVTGFIDHCGLEIDYGGSPPGIRNGFPEWFSAFRDIIEKVTFQYRLESARPARGKITVAVSLEPDFRNEISSHIDKIRKIVRSIDLEVNKKDRIFAKVDALQLEIDQATTPLDRFLSCFLDVSTAIGDSAEELERAEPFLRKIMKVMGRAKTVEDTKQLPKPEDMKSLPGPESTEDSETPSSDDKIPF